jgi:restriction system protein
MALWLVRAGRQGEHEQKFLENDRIWLTWWGLNHDMRSLSSLKEIQGLLREREPDAVQGKLVNNSGQIWAFVHSMKPGDWVVVPSKRTPSLHFAEIVGEYAFERGGPDPYYHFRNVKWLTKDVPRTNFDQDLLYSFGAFMTVCQIYRNDAENRIRAMAATQWQAAAKPIVKQPGTSEETPVDDSVDLERLAADEIAKLIIRRLKGHGLARLVEAVLKAQGYVTFLSPEGPDKGIDILAAPGPLGFGRPRLCVQVKSGDAPVDLPTLNQLIGSMQNVQAEQGLLVAWGGFRSTISREIPPQFFRVRLWDKDTLIQELLANYDKLDEAIRAELPLKRIWTVAAQELE